MLGVALLPITHVHRAKISLQSLNKAGKILKQKTMKKKIATKKLEKITGGVNLMNLDGENGMLGGCSMCGSDKCCYCIKGGIYYCVSAGTACHAC